MSTTDDDIGWQEPLLSGAAKVGLGVLVASACLRFNLSGHDGDYTYNYNVAGIVLGATVALAGLASAALGLAAMDRKAARVAIGVALLGVGLFRALVALIGV